MTFMLGIGLLFGISFAGIAYVLLRTASSGADAYTGAYSEDTARQFEDIFLFIPPRRIAEAGWAACAGIFILVFLLTGSFTSIRGAVLGLILASIAALLALRAPRFLLAFLRKRRLDKFNNQLVQTLMGMSNALKAGFSITQAVESVAKDGENPIAQEFSLFLQETRVGVSFTEALNNLDERVGSSDLSLVVQAIETARQTGGNLTEIFEKISATIRERMRIENRIRTLTAQGRMQGIVVGAMPAVIGVALLILDPELMIPFMHSALGIIIMASVVVLIFCGAMVIRKIIRIDV
ncbi:MAG: type II secretion system F family protein [Kiritimatiellia bacterium]